MTTWAQVKNGVALNPINIPPEDAFTPEWLEANPPAFEVVPDGTQHNAVSNGDGTFTNPAGAPKSYAILSKRAFIEMASAALGANGVGRKALGAILRGMASSVDDEVYTLSQQWESAITLDKAQLAGFMAILAANNIMTAQQRTLILNAWPVA